MTHICRTTAVREAPTHPTEDWLQVGVTRGFLLGMLYPWLAGLALSFGFGGEQEIGAVVVFGVIGMFLGVFAGPLLGGLVGGTALLLDRRVTVRASSRWVGASAVLLVAGMFSLVTAIVTCATGNSLGEVWGGLSFLVLGPAGLGLASLVVRPRVDRQQSRTAQPVALKSRR